MPPRAKKKTASKKPGSKKPGSKTSGRADFDLRIEAAIDRGNVKALAKLLDEAPADAKCTLGRTPLHYAAEKGRDKIVAMLIARGADLNARGFQDATPLHLAAFAGRAKACKLLLDAGAATEPQESHLELPIHCAASGTDLFKSRVTIVGDLIAAGSPLSRLDSAARSPLQIAAMMGNPDLVLLLLDALDNDPERDPEDLDTAADEAETYGFSRIAELIRARR